MHRIMSAIVAVTMLAAVPLPGFAASPSQARASAKPAAAKAKAKRAVSGTHSTVGVVKSVNDSTLVVQGTGKKKGEMTFVLESSTQREGALDVGAPVSVRYRENGSSHVATAVTARPHAKG